MGRVGFGRGKSKSSCLSRPRPSLSLASPTKSPAPLSEPRTYLAAARLDRKPQALGVHGGGAGARGRAMQGTADASLSCVVSTRAVCRCDACLAARPVGMITSRECQEEYRVKEREEGDASSSGRVAGCLMAFARADTPRRCRQMADRPPSQPGNGKKTGTCLQKENDTPPPRPYANKKCFSIVGG